jgi:predicted esterase
MTSKAVTKTGIVLVLAASLNVAMSQDQPAPQPAPAAATPQAAPAGPPRSVPDRRVQQRTYLFTDTNEQLPYALFVSSKVTKDKSAPLIVALHGLGGTQNTMVGERLKTIELAEQGGYIFVAPMGYNCSGWYGMPTGRPPGTGAPGRASGGAAGGGAARQGGPAAGGAPGASGPPRGRGAFGGMTCAGGGTAVTDAAQVRELSEKDVLNVLALVRKEFNVDDKRIYLMGHSMGGSGTLYLGAKHPGIWAAIAADAPPGAPNADGIAAARVPTLIIQGDADTAVPVAGTRRYVERLKELNAVYKYIEVPGLDHSIAGIPDMYEWFAKHSRQ